MGVTALYFGSFNPIHVGHLAVADYVVAEGVADEVWLVISPQNPHKAASVLAPETDRLEMAKRAVEGHRGVEICDVEFTMPKPSFTVLTIDRLRVLFPEREFAILGGEDVARTMHTWREGARLMSENTVFIYPRHNSDEAGEQRVIEYPPFRLLEGAPRMEVSSSQIRDMIARGDNGWKKLVVDTVAEYILDNNLYMTEIEKLLDEGKEAFARSEFGQAINAFNAVRQMDAENQEAAQWLDMIEEILAFRHKDYYNP